MTAERLREIRERLDGATEGSWHYHCLGGGHWCNYSQTEQARLGVPRNGDDALFIAHAPSDIRWLLERVEELEGTLSDMIDGEDELIGAFKSYMRLVIHHNSTTFLEYGNSIGMTNREQDICHRIEQDLQEPSND